MKNADRTMQEANHSQAIALSITANQFGGYGLQIKGYQYVPFRTALLTQVARYSSFFQGHALRRFRHVRVHGSLGSFHDIKVGRNREYYANCYIEGAVDFVRSHFRDPPFRCRRHVLKPVPT